MKSQDPYRALRERLGAWFKQLGFKRAKRAQPSKPWGGPTQRLQEFLSTAELEEARNLQNRVIAKLTTA
jgi:hypothetical protein